MMEFRKGKRVIVNLDKVAGSPGPYTMSYGFDLNFLCESIKRVGVINPPLLAGNREGGYDVVSGYRRILALKALGMKEAPCLDVTDLPASPMERFLTGFYENLATRQFNAIEKAMILQKLEGGVNKEEILAHFMPLLSLPSHERTLKFYLKLLELEQTDQKAIAVERISLHTAKALVEIEGSSRHGLMQWIQDLNLSFNQQLKFIEYITDITVREETSALTVLSEKVVLGITASARLNRPQKAKAVLEVLRARRTPRLEAAQQIVSTAVSAVPLPPEASIHYDPYLEDPHYRLEVRFRQGEELRKTLGKLLRSRGVDAIPEMWAAR